jgi:uncharacterized membrane protein YoaT (DUF817 family)
MTLPKDADSDFKMTSWLLPLRKKLYDTVIPLPWGLGEFIWFGLKMAWASLFGGLFLAALIITSLWWPENFALSRYDGLFLMAVFIQIIMLATGLETIEELKVIGLYHLIGTAMEIFKVHMGSWQYPDEALIVVAGVPLFTGFMYGSVGSFIARALRIFDMRFAPYPPMWTTLVLILLIYINFFTHHFGPDIRIGLFLVIGFLFFRTMIHYQIDKLYRRMPFLIAWILSAFFLWIAENVGTLTKTWTYPDQEAGWKMVGFAKMGSWALLLVISFVLVTLVVKIRSPDTEDNPSQGS